MVHFSIQQKCSISFNSEEIAKNFCNIYYDNMTNHGFEANVYLFGLNALCEYNEKTFVGAQKVADLYNSENIGSFCYFDLECTSSDIDNRALVVQVTGTMQAYPKGCIMRSKGLGPSDLRKFSEVFVLKLNEHNNMCVNNYIFKLM